MRARGERGMTLLELVVVILVLSLIAGAFLPVLLQTARARKKDRTTTEIVRIGEAVRHLYGDTPDLTPGLPPDPGRDDPDGNVVPDLGVLDDATGLGPYVLDELEEDVADAWSADAWGTTYRYRRLDRSPKLDGAWTRFEIVSAGPDRSFGTSDDLGRPFIVTDILLRRVRSRTFREARDVNVAIARYYDLRFDGSTHDYLGPGLLSLLAELRDEGLLPDSSVHDADGYEDAYEVVDERTSIRVKSTHFPERFLP